MTVHPLIRPPLPRHWWRGRVDRPAFCILFRPVVVSGSCLLAAGPRWAAALADGLGLPPVLPGCQQAAAGVAQPRLSDPALRRSGPSMLVAARQGAASLTAYEARRKLTVLARRPWPPQTSALGID